MRASSPVLAPDGKTYDRQTCYEHMSLDANVKLVSNHALREAIQTYSSLALERFSIGASEGGEGGDRRQTESPASKSTGFHPRLSTASMQTPGHSVGSVDHSDSAAPHDWTSSSAGTKTSSTVSSSVEPAGAVTPTAPAPSGNAISVCMEEGRGGGERGEDPSKSLKVRHFFQSEGEIRHWTRGHLLGRGAFGQVFMAMDSDTGRFFACKQGPWEGRGEVV